LPFGSAAAARTEGRHRAEERRNRQANECELDFAVHVGVRRVHVIAYVVTLIDARSTDPILHVVVQFTPAFDEHPSQV
jgi:hypothetical protein